MAEIYDPETVETLAEGLQGSSVCNDAINTARTLANERGRNVVLDDDDGCWLVRPGERTYRISSNWAANGNLAEAEEDED